MRFLQNRWQSGTGSGHARLAARVGAWGAGKVSAQRMNAHTPWSPMPDPLLLPERTRLFHIGPPKTASTALQQRAAAHREELLAHGVRYPGRGLTQRTAVAAFLARPVGWTGAGGNVAPSRRAWDRLMHEVGSDTSNRILFGHEYAAGADEATARAFVESIGPRAHVAVTLRDYGSMLPSIWQQYTKAGSVGTFDGWMRSVVERPRSERMSDGFFRRHDQGALVRRWAEVAGADHVTVIVLDRTDHEFVYSAFERLLGLPHGLLNSGAESIPANRGMSLPEIELMRRFNQIVQRRAPWKEYERLVLAGGALRMLETRTPPADEPRLQLPDWALEVVDDDAARYVAEIEASGVRVVGDLDALRRPAAGRSDAAHDHTAVSSVPIDAAAQAMAGLLSAGMDQGWDFGSSPAGRSARATGAADIPARDLIRELGARAARRARSLLGPRGR